MILSIGCNPAVDLILETEDFRANALNRVAGKRVLYGGKSMNFLTAAYKLGVECQASGFMGKRGAPFKQLLKSYNIPFKFVNCPHDVRTNVKIYSGANLTELNDEGFSVSEREQDRLIDLVEQAETDMLACSGSLPPEVREDFYYRLANAAGPKVKFACDCEKAAMMPALRANPVLIKPNRAELEAMTGGSLKTFSDIVNAARLLITRGAQNVLVSMGADGAIIVGGAAAFWGQYAQKVQAANPMGCGDTMFAAACGVLLMGGNLVDVLVQAVAAATLAVAGPAIAAMDMSRFEGVRGNVRVEPIK
ncbi:MAG: hexose kinase [Clostridiales bacterium]|jgi:1-phosphofructokinase|nr:hexose kinase [Clostridiales bacterium]